jgi:hypothetical protein
VLSQRELNRALLARQLLLERSRLPLPEALERVGGLQTQYAPSGYIGAWSRLEGFRRGDLTDALIARSAVQATLMRSTIHVVSAADYWLFADGTRRARTDWWLRAARRELDGVDADRAASRVRSLLADGPRRHEDLLAALEADGFARVAWYGTNQIVDMVRVPPSGTWERRRANLFGLADDWLGPSQTSEAEGLVHLVRRYLGGFGPATRNDAASWAGVPVTALRPGFDALDLRRFSDEEGRELLDLPDAPLPDATTPAPVRFIGTWDANLLVHARRTGFLPEAYRPRIFATKMPHSFPTFLVDGAVAGTWKFEEDRVQLTPFDQLPVSTLRRVEDEAERLAAFHRS